MIDSRVRENLWPVKILSAPSGSPGAERLLEPTSLQIGLDETHLWTVSGKGSLVLDFGMELNGGVRILTQAAAGGTARVRIRTGESVSEASAEKGERGAGNHHTLRDTETVLIPYSDMTFFETGFRFVRIDFLEDKLVIIKAITAVYVHRDLRASGGFTSSDARVNRIFDVASHTLTLNMQDYIWDGIKRDRLVWIGDLHPEAMGVYSLFGGDGCVEKALDYSRISTPLPGWVDHIPSYTMWWLVIAADHFMHTGDTAFLSRQRDYILGAFTQISALVDADGGIRMEEGMLFDWPSHGSADEAAGIHALCVLTAKKCKALFPYLGADIRACDALLKTLSKKTYTVDSFKQCEAFQVYAGVKDAKTAADFLCAGGAKGFSTFMSYYLLSAITDGAGAETAIDLMKQYYGGMLDMGATSFWEDFDLDWMENSCPIDRLPKAGERDIHGDFGKHCYIGFRHSLCHGWSCGPVPFLIRKLSGIEILEPGCKKLSIKPVTGGLKTYTLQYPTPLGNVVITLADGKFDIVVPSGIERV